MADEKSREQRRDEIERAAEQRRRDLENPHIEGEPDPESGAFNPVEGVPPHGAGIPDRK